MSLPRPAQEALEEILGRDDPDVLGVVLSGSAARGMATERSDVDVYVVLTPAGAAGRTSRKTRYVDEVPMTLEELEELPPLGTDDWWSRWSFAWAQVLLDRTDGRLTRAVEVQARLTGREQESVLVDRLDGYVNFVFRALKADCDGRPLERRLDAAESLTWWLDTVFALAGRVRPYMKYLPWELREHPLGVPEWEAERLLPLVERVLDGDPVALREGYATVERECRTWDARHGGALLGDTLDGWGDQLTLLRA